MFSRLFFTGFLLVVSTTQAQVSQSPRAYDVIIDEIMADPSPPAGLPQAEFIELKNRSGGPVHLSGWKLSSGSSGSGNMPDYTLPADSFLVLTTTANAALFNGFGRVLGLPGFPSLANEGGQVTLYSKEGRIIHAVGYSDKWYGNELKKLGGWTLEMTDTDNPCTGPGNWKASTDPSGGTPGRINSVIAYNPDESPPRLLRTYCPDSLSLMAVFDETLDSITAMQAGNYLLDNNISILSARAVPPLYNQVQLLLSSPLPANTTSLLTVSHLKDCSGNESGVYNKARAGRVTDTSYAGLVINEILFNPKPGGFDYVELFNSSNKIADAASLYLANRNATGTLASIKQLSALPFYIFPGDYLVLTEDPESLAHNYLVKNPEQVITMPVLPSYPDNQGIVVLLDQQGSVVEEVSYSEKWHFSLIADPEGIALERINPGDPASNAGNWHSAAATAGYGTPTSQNSQYRNEGDPGWGINISPKVFSPDNDGHEDLATIEYRVKEQGWVANVYVFDAGGRMIKNLVKNELLAYKGSWVWDGLDVQKRKLPPGIYIVLTELFNLGGKKRVYKDTIVLAGNR